MRPLPRLLAFMDDRVAALDDLDQRAAAIAAVGPAAALVARHPAATADALARLAARMVAVAEGLMAPVLVTGRADIAGAVAAQGVILRGDDLPPSAVRPLLAVDGWCLRSVHSEREADLAIAEGADALVVGTIWDTPSHPGGESGGISLLSRIVSRGVPSFAIGGVTPARAREAHQAGAWGVAAIRAAWDDERPCDAARRLIAPWLDL